MRVNIVTDSTADIPAALARELEIRVVPIYVHFGERIYRDGIDENSGQFYKELALAKLPPTTSQPTPEDFAQVYREASRGSAGIVSIHISARLSGTCSSAMLGISKAGISPTVTVIDSTYNSMGLGLLVIKAAELAKEGLGASEIVEKVRSMIPNIHMLGVFDTLKYAIAGGRINKTTGRIAARLSVKPLFTFHHGEVSLAGVARTYPRAVDRLFSFVHARKDISGLSIVHAAVPLEAAKLKERLGQVFDPQRIIISELGAALGAHGGPGVLLVALSQEAK
jgi:DegV family protein with EDD domain